MRDDEEAVQHAKGQSRHGEEVHGGDCLTVVAQKRSPPLRRLRAPRSFSHPTQHGSLGDVKAEHCQFAMNARPSPGGVFGYHAEDEFAQFLARRSSPHAGTVPREPFSIQLESGTMPTDDGFRPDEDQCALPFWPEPPQEYPEQLVANSESRLRVPLPQDAELLTQRKVFKEQIAARTGGSN